MKTQDARNFIGKELKVRDLLLFDNDIDVYDDVCGEIAIAFCNPFDDDEVHEWDEYLTEYGMEQFSEVLDYKIEVEEKDFGFDFPCLIINVDDEDGVWQNKLENAKYFLYACAGYIACDEYDKLFKI